MALDQLFASIDRTQFHSRYFGQRPCAQPGTATQFAPLFEWRALDRVLAAKPREPDRDDDVIVVNRGELIDVERPRNASDARAVMDRGMSLVVRRAQNKDPGLRELAAMFAQEFSGSVQIQLFITPRAERGFGWHYDAEDVFILQTVGSKEYFFRQNTVNPRPKPAPVYDFSAIQKERTPSFAATLIKGDWLYLPAGWWHAATALEDSLAISIGVLRPRPASTRGSASPPVVRRG